MSAILIGCASQLPAQKTEALVELYKAYTYSLPKTSDKELLKKYWSSARIAEGLEVLKNTSKENELNRNAIIFSIRFPREMKDILSMKQSIAADTACLLVVGLSDESKNMALNVLYVLESGQWKINEVFIKYVEINQLIPAEPNCDTELQ